MKVLIGRYPKNGDKDRKVNIHIQPWDTWGMDHTLSLIIHPMLVQLKAASHSAGLVDNEDVPEELRRAFTSSTEEDDDIDEKFFDRWDWVMDEMIWSFCEHKNDVDYSKFYEQSAVVESDVLKAYKKRKQNGFRLFGRYFQYLWE